MTADPAFRESTAERRLAALPLSHLSVEVGHLYMEDFERGPDHLRESFQHAGAWLEAARAVTARTLGGKRPRISTCFLVDDYFARFSTPAEVLPGLLAAAADNGVTIDYLARESACALTGDGVDVVEPARLVEARLVPSPPPGTDGSRPPVGKTGWLSNGVRSPAAGMAEAMSGAAAWRPPVENAAHRHSVFLDVELWDERDGRRTWSCPFLAAVWQLLRLGLLRNVGRPVAAPQPLTGGFPASWDDLPAVAQLSERAQPFSAYRSFSVLPARFLPVEHAVRTILEQVGVDPEVNAALMARATADGVPVGPDLTDRITYVFTNGPADDGAVAGH